MIVKTSAFEQIYASLSAARASLPCSTPNDPGSPNFVRDIVVNFVENLDYRPRDPITDIRTTYESLCSEFAPYNDGGAWFEALCRESSTMGVLPYPDHPPEVQLQIARYTWYLIYVDDLGQKFPSSLQSFQQRVFANESPEGAFLQALRNHLTDMYQLWDTIPANCINLSAMNYINGCIMEEMPVIRDMKISNAAHSWPNYLREKTGSAEAYAFMLFPMSSNLDISVYIQVINDIAFFTNLTNDIMSFYKEFLAGETNNYVSNRAHVTGKSLSETLQDTVDDTLAAYSRITKALEFTDASIAWKRFVHGYLDFHFSLKRYRLSELDI